MDSRRGILRNYYLLNPGEAGERKFKLILSQTDKGSLTAIVGDPEQPKEQSLRVTQNFELVRGDESPDGKGDLRRDVQGFGEVRGGRHCAQP